MEPLYADAKFKQLAIEFAIKSGMYADTKELIEDARLIESYLKEENDSKQISTMA